MLVSLLAYPRSGVVVGTHLGQWVWNRWRPSPPFPWGAPSAYLNPVKTPSYILKQPPTRLHNTQSDGIHTYSRHSHTSRATDWPVRIGIKHPCTWRGWRSYLRRNIVQTLQIAAVSGCLSETDRISLSDRYLVLHNNSLLQFNLKKKCYCPSNMDTHNLHKHTENKNMMSLLPLTSENLPSPHHSIFRMLLAACHPFQGWTIPGHREYPSICPHTRSPTL